MSKEKLLFKRDMLKTHLNKHASDLHKLNTKYNKLNSIKSGVATTRFWAQTNIYGLIAEFHEQNIVSEAAAWSCSVKKDVARNFAKITGKHLSLFFNKVAGLRLLLLVSKSFQFFDYMS